MAPYKVEKMVSLQDFDRQSVAMRDNIDKITAWTTSTLLLEALQSRGYNINLTDVNRRIKQHENKLERNNRDPKSWFIKEEYEDEQSKYYIALPGLIAIILSYRKRDMESLQLDLLQYLADAATLVHHISLHHTWIMDLVLHDFKGKAPVELVKKLEAAQQKAEEDGGVLTQFDVLLIISSYEM